MPINDPDSPTYGQRYVRRSPAEQQLIADRARAHQAVQRFANEQGTSYRSAYDYLSDPQPAAPTYSTPSAGSNYGLDSVGGDSQGGFSYGGGGGGGGGGGLGASEQATRSAAALQALLRSGAFNAPSIGVDPGLSRSINKAARRDTKTTRREQRAMNRYLKRTAENPYRTAGVERAPGAEGAESAAAFQNVLNILGADTRLAERDRRIEARETGRESRDEIRAGREAAQAGLRTQAYQQQLQMQQAYMQARLQALMQLVQAYGAGGGELPDFASLIGSFAPPARPTPGGKKVKKGGNPKRARGGGLA